MIITSDWGGHKNITDINIDDCIPVYELLIAIILDHTEGCHVYHNFCQITVPILGRRTLLKFLRPHQSIDVLCWRALQNWNK